MKSEDKIKLCRSVGVLLLADGQLTDEEYDFFNNLMNRLALSDDEKSTVKSSISIDTDLAADILSLREDGEGERLLEEMRAAATVDGSTARPEAGMIARVEAILRGE